MRHVRTSLLLRATAPLLALLAGVVAAAEPDAALAEARAALALEHQRAALLASWEKERADLERLATARAIALDAADAQLAELRAKLAARQAESAHLAEEAAGLAADQQAARATLVALTALLAPFPAASAPGVKADAEAPLPEQLRAAAAALEAVRAGAGRWEIEIAEGVAPGGATLAVQVVKAGYAAAWYISLDGAQAGTAQRAGARWTLHPDADPAIAAAVGAAIAQLRGNTVPEALLLPAPAPATPATRAAP